MDRGVCSCLSIHMYGTMNRLHVPHRLYIFSCSVNFEDNIWEITSISGPNEGHRTIHTTLTIYNHKSTTSATQSPKKRLKNHDT